MPNENEQRISRRRRLVFKFLTLIIGVVFAMVVLEIGLRIAGYSSPEFYETDPVLGYRLIPGMSGWYSREGRGWVEINSDGFRDIEHGVQKPPDVYRIAVIGDSYVEALQVDRDKSFANYLPPALANCGPLGGRNPAAGQCAPHARPGRLPVARHPRGVFAAIRYRPIRLQ